jgi:hypothetical protein
MARNRQKITDRPGKNRQDGTNRREQAGWIRQERTDRTEQTGWNRQDGTDRKEQTGENHQFRNQHICKVHKIRLWYLK